MFAATALLLTAAATPAAPAAGPADRTHVRLPDRKDDRPYSDAVVVGKTIYLSGKIGLDAAGKPPSDGTAEARLVMERVKGTLEAVGAVHASYFKKSHPARAFIGTGPLLFGARFEVQGVAVKR
jgi:2-iminobutanoate/2-iminopropanoate deaminase